MHAVRAISARLWRGGPQIRISKGNVTDWRGDVLVNCANETCVCMCACYAGVLSVPDLRASQGVNLVRL
jgi:hypothetical protein